MCDWSHPLFKQKYTNHIAHLCEAWNPLLLSFGPTELLPFVNLKTVLSPNLLDRRLLLSSHQTDRSRPFLSPPRSLYSILWCWFQIEGIWKLLLFSPNTDFLWMSFLLWIWSANWGQPIRPHTGSGPSAAGSWEGWCKSQDDSGKSGCLSFILTRQLCWIEHAARAFLNSFNMT